MQKQTDANPRSLSLFQTSLANWGGWHKLVTGESDGLIEPLTHSLANYGQWQKTSPSQVGKLPMEEWQPIAEVIPLFLNACLHQELARILDGSGHLDLALRMVGSRSEGLFLMAAVLIARELHLRPVIVHNSPFERVSGIYENDLSMSTYGPTLLMQISAEHGEEVLPLLFHYTGQKDLWDEENSLPGELKYVPVAVDQKLAVFFDGTDHGSLTLQQHQRDCFLLGQRIQTVRYSKDQVTHDVFRLAGEAIKSVTGQVLPPPSV